MTRSRSSRSAATVAAVPDATDVTPSSAQQPPSVAGDELLLARKKLHVSAVPDRLPCREEEYAQISAYLESALLEQTGSCLYVSGVPGTGKTATVREVLRQVRKLQTQGELADFSLLEINGMALTDPNYAYTVLWQHLTGGKATVPPSQAEKLLEAHFSQLAAARPNSARLRNRKCCVVVMDELDQLVTRTQTVMYNFFNWPIRPQSDLIVIAIANTMDLPERMLSNKISSRLGLKRVNFQPYTFQQLTMIIQSRLQGLRAFDAKAVEFCARKVSAVSGDARRALDICRRAAEIVGNSGGSADCSLVTIEAISRTISEMTSAPAMQMIMTASLHQKIFLHAITLALRQSGLTETTFGEVAKKHIDFCRMNNVEPARTSDLATICLDLAAVHIILAHSSGLVFDTLYQKIRLNVSQEDVTMAFRLDEFMKTFT